ncbi:ATP-binding protein [Rhizohabitans arisaemae]|uniref:ATP-binding protein n=1 Tax=Rhizohabitans arisaemae TaxID=2720610 RepID=UPI0024B0CBE4|nr:NB-ARC domain-containing protein [Rhizohabitans arisaemae]
MGGADGNLPVQRTGFVGRGRELKAIAQLLEVSRLVTVTGIGGAGKSRVAVEAADRLRERFPDGIWHVDASRLRHEDLLVHMVAAALKMRDQSARSEMTSLVEFLEGRTLLIVLDSCEVMSDACAELVDELLRSTSGVSVLATGRRLLDVPGELSYLLPPLSLPPAEDPSAEQVLRSEAGELFEQRARVAARDFTVNEETAPLVADLCHRLDGIPLAIELAAVQLRTLSLREILARIGEDRLDLLTGSRRGTDRHRTLRAAIGSSHELCEPQEKLLWARMSVFSGDCGLAALEQICSDDRLPGDQILPAVQGLVEKSILIPVQGPLGIRYRLLETVRVYGAEWLKRLEETETLQRRHRDYYLRLAVRGDQAWSGRGQLYWYVRIQQEHANIQTALEYCLDNPGEVLVGLDLVSSLWFLWVGCGWSRVGRRYLERALEASPEPSVPRCRALWVYSYVVSGQGDIETALRIAQECSRTAGRIGDFRSVLFARKMMGTAAFLNGELYDALSNLGATIASSSVDQDLNPCLLPATVELALTLTALGEAEQAMSVLEDCILTCEQRGELWLRSYAYYARARAQRATRSLVDAAESTRASLRIKQRFHDVLGVCLNLELLALIACDQLDVRRAATLLGAAQANWRSFGLPLMGSASFGAEHEQCVKECLAIMGEERYQDCFEEGQAMNLDEAITFAIE